MRFGGVRAAAGFALVAWGLAAGEAAAEVRLLRVEALRDPGGTRIELRSDGPLPRTDAFRLEAPGRVVLDLPGVVNASGRDRLEVGAPDVVRVRLGRHPGFLRVVLDLSPRAAAGQRVERGMRGVTIALGALPLPAVGAEPPPALAPSAAAADVVRVYGIELQAAADRDRVLVFAERALEAELVTLDADTVELRLLGAALEPSAARHLEPEVGGAVSDVVAFAPISAGRPEVRLRIERSPHAPASLSRRGAILAVEFPVDAATRDAGLTLSFVDAELADVVRDIARATGVSFVFDERLRGRVTISVVERVSKREAVEILQAALLGHAFAAVPSPGGALRILPIDEARAEAPRKDTPDAGAAAPVTTLLRLRSAAASDLAATLRPQAGTAIVVAPFIPTNSLILAGSEAQVRRYLALSRALDDAESVELAMVTLRHREAEEIAGILREAWPPEAPREGGTQRAGPEFWHDARSNSVLMRAPTRRLAELRAWIAELDRPPSGHGAIRVIRPRNADATRLAETLQQLGQGDPRAARGAAGAASLVGRRFQVAAHESTGALLVQADPETQALVRELVEEIDRRPPSISVDVLVLEIGTTRSLSLGLDAFLPFGDADDPDETALGAFSIRSGDVFQNVTDPRVGFFRYARDPLVIPIIGPGGIPTQLIVPRESVQITAAAGDVTTRTLLRPHLVALSGEEHELSAGDNVPVLIGAKDEAGQPLVSDVLTIRNEIERRDVGTRLRVRPTAGQAGDVRLELEVEASRLRPIPVEIATRIGPVIEQRKLEAVTRLEHGQIAVLGMVLDDAVQEIEGGVPFLKDVPILGWLARSTHEETVKRTLVIAVQAGIERSPEARLADSVRHRLAFERTLARRGALRIGAEEGYALLVTTRASDVEARGVASALAEANAKEPRVVAWEWDGEPRFDVYVGGFATLSEAGAAAAPLVAEGWKPEVVALPPQPPPPASPREK